MSGEETVTSSPATVAEDLGSGAPVLGGRWQIVGLVGSGGMGTVYRARDRELEETVAVKVLRHSHASPDAVDRLRREVRLARKVTHKNVVRMFDIGEDGGERFLTMEYVDGESLSDVLKRERRLGADRVTAIAHELAAALEASHDAGVLHGDLKPSNVLVERGGRIVITDFGISRAFEEGAAELGQWSTAGTPAYMAPEHVSGDVELDARADLYALGCVLYCLLVGRPPWVGTSYAAVAAARLLHEPPDPRASADVPDALAELVLRCMTKDRDSRIPSAAAVRAALPRCTRVASAEAPHRGAIKSLAVLPMASAEEHEHLAHGVANAIVESLGAIEQVQIVGRGAKASGRDARDAGRALRVDAVLDGAFAYEDGAPVLTVRLLAVDHGFTLFAQRYEAAPEEVLRVAETVARDIARSLAADDEAVGRLPSLDPTTLDLYTRGRWLYTRGIGHQNDAVDLLRRAHERMPEDGHLAAAYALAFRRQLAVSPTAEDRAASRALTEEVAAKHPDIPEANVALALVHFDESELRSAAIALRRALLLDPSNLDANEYAAMLLLEVGRIDDALAHALAANESSPFVASLIARAYALRGDWANVDAVVESRYRSPQAGIMRWLARARFALWRHDPEHTKRERALFEHETTLTPGTRHEIVAFLFDVATTRMTSDEMLHRVRAIRGEADGPRSVPRRTAFLTQMEIEALCAAGRHDDAAELFDVLEDSAFGDLGWLEHCPLLVPLRSHPRFVAVRRSTTARARRVLEVFEPTEQAPPRRT